MEEKLTSCFSGAPEQELHVGSLSCSHTGLLHLYYHWRDVFLQGMKAGPEKGRNHVDRAKNQEIEKLLKQIGKLVVEIYLR